MTTRVDHPAPSGNVSARTGNTEQQDRDRASLDPRPSAVSYPPVSGGNTPHPDHRPVTNTAQKPRSGFTGRENAGTHRKAEQSNTPEPTNEEPSEPVQTPTRSWFDLIGTYPLHRQRLIAIRPRRGGGPPHHRRRSDTFREVIPVMKEMYEVAGDLRRTPPAVCHPGSRSGLLSGAHRPPVDRDTRKWTVT